MPTSPPLPIELTEPGEPETEPEPGDLREDTGASEARVLNEPTAVVASVLALAAPAAAPVAGPTGAPFAGALAVLVWATAPEGAEGR